MADDNRTRNDDAQRGGTERNRSQVGGDRRSQGEPQNQGNAQPNRQGGQPQQGQPASGNQPRGREPSQPVQGQGGQPQQGPPGQPGRPPGDGGGSSWLPGGLQWTPLTILIALLLVGGAAAGVFVATGGDLPLIGSGGSASLDSVPEGVDMVMYADSGIVDDGTTETMMNGLLSMSAQSPTYSGPTSYSELKDEMRGESDIDPDGFESATLFATYPEQSMASADYAGVIVDSEWSESEMVSTIEENGQQLEEQTYSGTTVYVQPTEFGTDTWLAPLGDGTFVMGSEAAVTDVIDVDAGEKDAFSGELKNTYTSLRDGYVKFATTMPDQATQQAGSFTGTGQMAQNVERVAGVYYTSGSDVGMELTLTGADQSGAESVKETIDAGLSLATMGSQESSVSDLVDAVEVSQNGEDVTITFEYAAEELVTVIEQYASGSALAA